MKSSAASPAALAKAAASRAPPVTPPPATTSRPVSSVGCRRSACRCSTRHQTGAVGALSDRPKQESEPASARCVPGRRAHTKTHQWSYLSRPRGPAAVVGEVVLFGITLPTHGARSSPSSWRGGHVRVSVRPPLSDTPTVFHKFHFNMTLERKKRTPLLRLSAGPTLVNSGRGPDRSLARARARPPMRAVPLCRTRVSSRRSSGDQEPQWVTRGLSALHKQPRPPLRCDKDKATEKPNARHVGNGMEGASRVMGTLARNSFHNE